MLTCTAAGSIPAAVTDSWPSAQYVVRGAAAAAAKTAAPATTGAARFSAGAATIAARTLRKRDALIVGLMSECTV